MKHIFTLLFIFTIFLSHNDANAQQGLDIQQANDSILRAANKLQNNYQFEEALKMYKQHLEKESLSTEAITGAAFCAYQSGQLALSESLYQQLLFQDSTNKPALANLAAIAMKMNQYRKARDYYLAILSLNNKNAYFQKQAGLVFDKLGKPAKAIKHLQEALILNEKDTDAALKLASIYYTLENYENALNTVQSALHFSTENLALVRLKLKVYYRLDSNFMVMKTGHKLLQLGDTTNNTLKMAGVAYFNEKIYQRAIDFLSLLPEDQKTPSILYYLGISYREQFYFKKSEEALSQAIEKSIPSHFERYFIHKSLTQLKLDDYKGAVETCTRGLEITQNEALYFHLARAYDSWYKDKQPAIKYYEKYLQSARVSPLYEQYTLTRLQALKAIEHFSAPDSLQEY